MCRIVTKYVYFYKLIVLCNNVYGFASLLVLIYLQVMDKMCGGNRRQHFLLPILLLRVL